MAFLFGDLAAWADPDDPEERAELLSRSLDEDLPGAVVQFALRTLIAHQIADDDPPQVWATVQRLLAAGHGRDEVMQQVSLAFTPTMIAAVTEGQPFQRAEYLRALERLPLPSADDVEQAMLGLVRSRRSVPIDELEELVTARLGLRLDDPVLALLFDRVEQQVIDEDGPLEVLASDHVVHVEALTDDIVLTHEISPAERDTGVLPLGADLAGFRRRDTLTLADGAALSVTGDGWIGPVGWLADVPAYGVVAIHVRGAVVRCLPMEAAPAIDDELVALLRAGYDDAVAEPWLPVPVEELVLQARLSLPTAFAAPTAPLSRLLDAAGLEVRGGDVAHEASVWRNVAKVRRTQHLLELPGGVDLLREVSHVLGLIEEEPPDTATARHILDDLYDPAVLEVVADELLGRDDDPELLRETGVLARRLVAAASRPEQQAVAHWLVALVAEREGRLEEAQTQLRSAVRADPTWFCGVDRLAWYCSDRGDAETALTLWQGTAVNSADSEDIRLLESFSVPAARRPGRNQPCWCGSGRKFKQCHLGRTALPPLPERIGWICRKAVAYLERRGGPPGEVVYEHAAARALDPDDPDSLQRAMEDPLVLDVVLHEGGWFDRFLDERGGLLPADEAMLARAWTLVERTVYELLEVRAGIDIGVRDLRTGELFDVREQTFSRTAQQGALVCGRAVPDGQSHQFVGGLFVVPPGRERDVLALLDQRDGLALLAYVADLLRPPVIVGPDGRVLELGELDLDALARRDAAARPAMDPQMQEAMLEFLEQQEQRWCEEPVPALGGITPLAAAADPTRREELVRLIASFPSVDPAGGTFSLRPEKLRARLGLAPSR